MPAQHHPLVSPAGGAVPQRSGTLHVVVVMLLAVADSHHLSDHERRRTTAEVVNGYRGLSSVATPPVPTRHRAGPALA
jgi:hypothetical protein